MSILQTIIRIILYVFYILFGLYLVACILLYLFQERLLFFSPGPILSYYENISQNPGLKNHRLVTVDGYMLDGWQQISSNHKKTILYFGGNAEDVSYFVGGYFFKNANIIAFNYRGYGYSTGKPNQKFLFNDAHQIYNYLIEELGISSDDIYVMGRSLGTGVATYLASKEKFAGVILVTPYDSIENIAKEAYALFPVSLILRNKFLSYEYAQVHKNHLLSIYGGRDIVVPNSHTENLLKYWNGSIERVFIPEADHDTITSFNQFQESIDDFINREETIY